MATTERDYYELLGVGRGASEAEIKSAFRRLARELHPDVSDAPDAQERFREVVEAYEVLSKTETRELYDRYGHAGLRSGGFQPGHFDFGNLADLFSAFFGDDVFGGRGGGGRARGADLAATVEIDLVEAAHGVTREVPFRGRRRLRALRRRRRGAGHRDHDLPDVQRLRAAATGLAQRLRRVRPDAGVSDLRRLGPQDRAAVHRVPRRRPCRRGAAARRRHPAGDPRRPADPPERRGACRRWSAGRPATSTWRCGSVPTSGSCARATTSSRPST